MKKQNKKQGFTLVELLVVIAILAILATVSIVGYTAFIKKAHQANALAEANQIKTAIQAELISGNDFVINEVETPADETAGTTATTTTTVIRRVVEGDTVTYKFLVLTSIDGADPTEANADTAKVQEAFAANEDFKALVTNNHGSIAVDGQTLVYNYTAGGVDIDVRIDFAADTAKVVETTPAA